VILDSKRTLLVWEVPHYPQFYVPVADVRMERLTATQTKKPSKQRGEGHCFDVDGAAAAAWHYPDHAELKDHVRFEWDALDAWLEEEEEVFVHPHDPYKRIDILNSSRHIVVHVDGVKVADSHRPTLVFETGAAAVRYYVPKSDVRMELLTPTDLRTGCAYKGFARYWNVCGKANLAWSYPAPLEGHTKLAGLVSFYNEHLDIDVDGVREQRPAPEE
jgi:uncharacterized protein (DUF427 family)